MERRVYASRSLLGVSRLLKGPPPGGVHLSSLGPIGTPLRSEEQEEVPRHA